MYNKMIQSNLVYIIILILKVIKKNNILKYIFESSCVEVSDGNGFF